MVTSQRNHANRVAKNVANEEVNRKMQAKCKLFQEVKDSKLQLCNRRMNNGCQQRRPAQVKIINAHSVLYQNSFKTLNIAPIITSVILSTHLEFWVIIHKNCNYSNIWDITVNNKKHK